MRKLGVGVGLAVVLTAAAFCGSARAQAITAQPSATYGTGLRVELCSDAATSANVATQSTACFLDTNSIMRMYNANSAAFTETYDETTSNGVAHKGLAVSIFEGTTTTLNLTASTLLSAGQHRVFKVMVVTAGSTAGTINDSSTTGGAATSNAVATIPNTAGTVVDLNALVTNGLVVVPGTSQQLSVTWQ